MQGEYFQTEVVVNRSFSRNRSQATSKKDSLTDTPGGKHAVSEQSLPYAGVQQGFDIHPIGNIRQKKQDRYKVFIYPDSPFGEKPQNNHHLTRPKKGDKGPVQLDRYGDGNKGECQPYQCRIKQAIFDFPSVYDKGNRDIYQSDEQGESPFYILFELHLPQEPQTEKEVKGNYSVPRQPSATG